MYKEKKVWENKNFNLGIKFNKKYSLNTYFLDNNKVITQKSEEYLQKSIFNLQQKRLLSKKNMLLTVW